MVFALLTLILSAQHMVNPQYILLDEQLCDHIPFFNLYCYKVNITEKRYRNSLTKIEVPCDLALPLLSVYLEEMKAES